MITNLILFPASNTGIGSDFQLFLLGYYLQFFLFFSFLKIAHLYTMYFFKIGKFFEGNHHLPYKYH